MHGPLHVNAVVHGSTALMVLRLFIVHVSWSHSDTLFWRSDKLVAELLLHKSPSGPRSPQCPLIIITFRHSPFSRTPLHWSAHRRNFYL